MDDAWTREAREIFGNPPLPGPIWEEQFDEAQDHLEALAQTEWKALEYGHIGFWAYFHDLTYVEPLQPDLFAHAFPLCMAKWRRTFMSDQDCSVGDADFHRALHRGRPVDKMVPHLKKAVFKYFLDGFFERLDAEPPVPTLEDARTPSWIYRLNAMAKIEPLVPKLLPSWFAAETVGRAMCLVHWLCYLTDQSENDPNVTWSSLDLMVEDDGQIWGEAWREDNVQFLSAFLTIESIRSAIDASTERLSGTGASSYANRLKDVVHDYPDFVQRRLLEFIDAVQVPLRPVNDFLWQSHEPSLAT